MSKSQQTEQIQTQRETWIHAKTMLSAVLGAIIGCGASLHTYYNLLGGADQVHRLAQVESTVEHNRQVGEETLALLKQLQTDTVQRAARADDALSKKPTQRELSDALDGLFEKLPEAGETAAQPNDATDAPANVQQNASAQAGAKAGVEEDEAAASNEAAKK
uniref:Lipoprotein n=1 Tax=Pseudomonas fluorescens (strain SBW25) TaxID=216595 RepID=A0A0G4E4P1_PSEFS|nr:hypothetical protein [Pseudomonas fluorescens]CEK42139.1 hypothetical protein PQBR57_0186 [Pseudomonas fluorescens SBW25]